MSLRLFALLSLFSVTLFAASEPVELSEPFYAKPVLYDGAFYGFSDGTTFSKVSDAGQVSWRIQDQLDAENPFQLHFNHIVFLRKNGNVIAYDSALGNEIWLNETVQGTDFFIRYPYVYVLTVSGSIESLDLFTGRKKWTNKEGGFSSFRPAGRSGVVLARKGRSVVYLESQLGSKVRSITLRSSKGTLVSDWNRNVVRQVGSQLQLIDTLDGTVSVSSVQPSENMTWFQDHYPVVVDDKKGTLRQYDVETNMLQWETVPTHDIQDVHFSEAFALLTVPSDNMVLVDLKDGESYFHESIDVDGAIQGVYDDAKSVFILYQKEIVKLDKTGLKNE